MSSSSGTVMSVLVSASSHPLPSREELVSSGKLFHPRAHSTSVPPARLCLVGHCVPVCSACCIVRAKPAVDKRRLALTSLGIPLRSCDEFLSNAGCAACPRAAAAVDKQSSRAAPRLVTASLDVVLAVLLKPPSNACTQAKASRGVCSTASFSMFQLRDQDCCTQPTSTFSCAAPIAQKSRGAKTLLTHASMCETMCEKRVLHRSSIPATCCHATLLVEYLSFRRRNLVPSVN